MTNIPNKDYLAIRGLAKAVYQSSEDTIVNHLLHQLVTNAMHLDVIKGIEWTQFTLHRLAERLEECDPEGNYHSTFNTLLEIAQL